MKHVKVTAGLAHVSYGRTADLAKEVSDAGVDYIHSDTADVHDLQSMKLMGGHQITAGIRPETDKPIECHIYTISMDRMFIKQIDEAGADMLIIPAERFISAQLAYIINWYHERHIKVSLTLGCYTPLCSIEEDIYDIDRLHIVTHGINETDGKDNWEWRKSTIDLVQRARKTIDEKNPKYELTTSGGLRTGNTDKLIECSPNIIVLSSTIFKDPDEAAAGMKRYRATIDTAAERYGFE